MLDWNDLRFFLAVADHGGTKAAARELGVDPSTVQRRIMELERQVGQALIHRLPSGYSLTDFGERMLAPARQVAQAVALLEQQLEDATRDVAGRVRLTCPEPLMLRLTRSGLIERFHARYPAVQLEFVISDRYLNLTAGDADVALRSGDTDDLGLVGRKVADSLWAVYASKTFIERHGAPNSPQALAQFPLVGFDETLSNHRASTWLRTTVPEARVVARNNSVLGLVNAAKAGLGVAPLPTAIADAEPDLTRLFGPVPELTRVWRLLTTPELRKTPRVNAVFEFFVSEVDALQSVLTGP
jgi:DNA-binding transcriptional LysR family regulator